MVERDLAIIEAADVGVSFEPVVKTHVELSCGRVSLPVLSSVCEERNFLR